MTGIGERINARRKELGMTQEELSKKLGYKNKSTISQIENGVNDIMQSKVASFAEALNTTVAYLVGLEEPTQPKKNASGMKYAKIREIRNQLERCRYVVMSAEAKIKRVEPLSQKFEQTVQLIQDTKEQVNNLVWQELRCKEELRAEEQQERKRFTVVCERSETITSVRNVPERNEKGRRCGSRMLTRKNTDSALQRSKTTNRAAALPETVTRGRRTAAG